MASIVMGFAIIVEASLSFLGLGALPTTPSWGQMLSEGRSFIEDAPWLVLAPGITITVVVLAFNMLGDALRDHLDPSLRGR
jgi:peptide/nickel transport system permease protein